MNNLEKTIETLYEQLNGFIPLIEMNLNKWCETEDSEVSWVDDGEYYSSEINAHNKVRGVSKCGKYVVYDLDNGCGDTVTTVFLAENEVEDLEEGE